MAQGRCEASDRSYCAKGYVGAESGITKNLDRRILNFWGHLGSHLDLRFRHTKRGNQPREALDADGLKGIAVEEWNNQPPVERVPGFRTSLKVPGRCEAILHRGPYAEFGEAAFAMITWKVAFGTVLFLDMHRNVRRQVYRNAMGEDHFSDAR